MPVELISANHTDPDTFQNQINEFLEQNNVRLIDIKFTEVAGFHPKTGEADGGWSALIIYEQN